MLRRLARAALSFAILPSATLLLSAFPALAGGLPPMKAEYAATQTLSVNGADFRMSLNHAKGRERRELSLEGTRSVLILRPDRQEAFVLQPEAKVAMPIGLGDPEVGPDLSTLHKLDAVPQGKEKVGGLDTVKYRVSGVYEEGGGFEGTVWATDDGIYAKVDGTATDGGEPVMVRLELADVTRGRQDPALFELPAGTAMMDFDPMGGRVPEVLAKPGQP